MAVSTFGLTWEDILRRIPFDTDMITPTSSPVSTSDITEYIKDAGAKVAGILGRQNLTEDDVSDDDERQIQTAMISYVVREIYKTLGVTGSEYRTANEEWNQAKAELKSNSTTLSSTRSSRVRTTVDTSASSRPSRFGGKNYKF